MGGLGSGKQRTKYNSQEEYIEANRAAARLRYQLVKEKKQNVYQTYKDNYKKKFENDKERLGYLREPSRVFGVNEDPAEWLKYIREKNRKRLDEILNDDEAMKRIFAERDDISELQKAQQKQKKHMSDKEIKEKLRQLEEEFNLLEDRKEEEKKSVYKNQNEENEQ